MDMPIENDSVTSADNLTERVIEGSLLVVICILAIGGNLLLWVVVVRSSELHFASNVLLLSLSAADLLVSVVNMPLTAYTIFLGRWEFSQATCLTTGFSNMFFLVASVMSLCMITLNRYVRICLPTRYHTWYSRRDATLQITGVWCLSAALSMPPLLGWGEYGYLEAQYLCYSLWEASLSYSIFMVTFCFGGTSSLMTFCYVSIYRTFTRSKRQIRSAGKVTDETVNEMGQQLNTVAMQLLSMFFDIRCGRRRLNSTVSEIVPQVNVRISPTLTRANTDTKLFVSGVERNPRASAAPTVSVQISVPISEVNAPPTFTLPHLSIGSLGKDRRRREEMRLTSTMLVVVMIYVISWLPYCVMILVKVLTETSSLFSVEMITLLMGYSNSVYNPFIYGWRNPGIRRAYLKLWQDFREVFVSRAEIGRNRSSKTVFEV